MSLMKVLPVVLALIFIPVQSFADAPDISYGQSSFNFAKGYYTLTDNVSISINNHGFKATLSANEAKVHLIQQKCLASGKVTLMHENIVFTCDEAFAKLKGKNAVFVGKVNFQSKDALTITADKATFNWNDRVADFYGKVKIKTDKNFKVEGDLKPKGTYMHVRYNVETQKILALDKDFDMPEIVIPDFDE